MCPGKSHSLPNKDAIQQALYEHHQTYMKTDILLKLKKKEMIEKEGLEAWQNFLLDCGKEEVVIKHETK